MLGWFISPQNHGVYDSDEDVEDKENDFKMNSESEDELIESDLELEGETVEPDNDPPQKVAMIELIY